MPKNEERVSNYLLVQQNSFLGQSGVLGNDLEAYLWVKSQEYGLDYEKIYTLIQKESGWNANAVGDAGKAYGIAQFWRGTFYGYAKRYGMDELQYENPSDQILLMVRMIADGQAFNWTAARGIKTFADKL